MSLWTFPRRPDWLAPGQGFVLDLLNRFAPREENVIWLTILRAFPARPWKFWMAISATCFGLGLCFPEWPFFILVYAALYGWGHCMYISICPFSPRFSAGKAAHIFSLPIGNAEFIAAFGGLYRFLLLSLLLSLLLIENGYALAFFSTDVKVYPWVPRELIIGSVIDLFYYAAFTRFVFWCFVARDTILPPLIVWFLTGRAANFVVYPISYFIQKHFQAGLLHMGIFYWSRIVPLSIAAAFYVTGGIFFRSCRKNYTQMAGRRLFL